MMYRELFVSMLAGMAAAPMLSAQDALEIPVRSPVRWIGSGPQPPRALMSVRKRLSPYSPAVGFRSPFIQPLAKRRPKVSDRPVFLRRSGPEAVRGGARIGMLVGLGLGLAVGSDAFSGADLGCDQIECYGTLGKGEARAAGAIVAGGIGFLCGSLLGAVVDADWLKRLPLDGLKVAVTPDGRAAGMRLKLSLPVSGS